MKLVSTLIFLTILFRQGYTQRKNSLRTVEPIYLRTLSTEGSTDQKKSTSLCHLDCSKEHIKPVCGSNGVSYASRCHLHQAICQGVQVRYDYKGKCSQSETRCIEERQTALKTSNESGIPLFIPLCRDDGSYVEVQCHYGTGYCWCVNQDGRPIPGSSVLYDKPKCTRQEKRRRNRRGKKKKRNRKRQGRRVCTQADRSQFNSHVIELVVTEFGTIHGRTPTEPRTNELKKEMVEWKFDQMDTDRNGNLRKKEFKSFRRKVKQVARNKLCARNFWQYCDMNGDRSISKDEWTSCLGLNINISFKLFMSLSSEEDQDKRRKEKHKKRKQEEESYYEREDDDYEEETSGVNGLSFLDSSDHSTDRQDCQTARKDALESIKSGVPNAYVPECDEHGQYSKVQCHETNGQNYCWCADGVTGEPIPATSIENSRPDCALPARALPVQADRPWKKCPEHLKKQFQARLMDFLTKMMATHLNDTSMLHRHGLDEHVARWHFNHLDSNRDGVVSRKELRPLRRTLKSDSDLKRCGKRFQMHCDLNSDQKINLNEWNDCLGVQTERDLAQKPTNSRKGPNPLRTWLKAD